MIDFRFEGRSVGKKEIHLTENWIFLFCSFVFLPFFHRLDLWTTTECRMALKGSFIDFLEWEENSAIFIFFSWLIWNICCREEARKSFYDKGKRWKIFLPRTERLRMLLGGNSMIAFCAALYSDAFFLFRNLEISYSCTWKSKLYQTLGWHLTRDFTLWDHQILVFLLSNWLSYGFYRLFSRYLQPSTFSHFVRSIHWYSSFSLLSSRFHPPDSLSM
jgi:hypothetical protein